MTIPHRLATDGWWLNDQTAPASMSPPHQARRSTMTSIPSDTIDPSPSSPFTLDRFAIAALVTAAADWLFFGWSAGLSVALFQVVLVAAAFAAARGELDRRRTLVALAILTAAVAPVVETLDTLSCMFAVFGTALAAAVLTQPRPLALADRLTMTLRFVIAGPFRLLPDMVRSRRRWFALQLLITWAVPVLFGAMFVALFASANPLIAQWTMKLDPRNLNLDGWRLLFWTVFLSIAWAFVAPRWRLPQRKSAQATRVEAGGCGLAPSDDLLGPASVLRSLIVFNLLFAVETGLDLTYLWGGVTLPEGMTHAAYAHRGAYPLVLTTLLAAAFILLATQRADTRQSRPIRLLIYAWTVQNLLLSVSSVLRLAAYVEVYSLTYWRVAAFIWMGLVAAGLVSIVARMTLQRSNRWLLDANLAVLAATLYACAFINFPSLVGSYNVMHSRELTHQGVNLDTNYLASLGPHALPAIDCFIASGFGGRLPDGSRASLAAALTDQLTSWRTWSFRSWRVARRIAGETTGDASHSCR